MRPTQQPSRNKEIKMDLLTSLSLLTGATKNIYDLAKAFDTVKKSADIKMLQNQFATMQGETLDSIIQAKITINSLVDENQELKNEKIKLINELRTHSEYERKEIAAGFFAYVEKVPALPYESAHKFCCNCYDKEVKSTLVTTKTSVAGKHNVSCHECRLKVHGLSFHSRT